MRDSRKQQLLVRETVAEDFLRYRQFSLLFIGEGHGMLGFRSGC